MGNARSPFSVRLFSEVWQAACIKVVNSLHTMTHNPWGNYKTAPVPVKIAGWITIPFVLFFIMHTVIQFIYEDEMAKGTFVVATWIYELYHFIWCGLPLFL